MSASFADDLAVVASEAGGSRPALVRIAAMHRAMDRGEAFRQRVREAAGDAARLADLMAEAVDMLRGSRENASSRLDAVEADYCLDTVRAAYLAARVATDA